MADTRLFPTSGMRRRFLPLLLLSLLPLGLLLWQAGEEDRRVAAEADRAWIQATEPIARFMGQSSKPTFWLELAARRFRSWTERDLRRGRAFATAAERGGVEAGLPGLPKLQAWVVEFPDGNLAQPGKSLAGGRLATMSRRLVAGILQDAARSKAGGAGSPSRTAVAGLFGVGTSPELFTAAGRGQAFHVVFGRLPALVVWDVIEIGPRCRGAFLLMMPIETGDRRVAIKATLANWQRLVRKGGLIPAFMPLPAKPGPVPGPILSIPGPKGRRAVQGLRQWRNRPRIEPGAALEIGRLRPLLHESPRLNPELLGRELMGKIRLGGYRSGEVERLPGTGLKSRVALLDPLTMRVGLLLAPDLQRPAIWQKRALMVWTGGLALLLVAGMALPTLGIRFGSSGVRRELMAWFLVLAAIPLTLTVAAAWKYQNDLQINQTEGLCDELMQEFAALEVGGDRLSDRYQAIFRTVSSRPDLLQRIRDVESGKASETVLMRSLLGECRRRGADPIGIVIVSRTGGIFSGFLPSVPVGQQEMLTLVLDVLGRNQFYFGSSAASGPVRTRKGRSVMLAKAMEKMAESQQETAQWNQAEERSQMTTGGKSTHNYHRMLYEGNKQAAGVVFLWDEERVRRRFLAQEVPNVARRRGITIAAFRRQVNGIGLLAAGGEGHFREPLRRLARQARETPILVSRGEALMVAAPTQRMSQFVLAAAISKERILVRLALERQRFFAMITGLILLILTAVWGLTTWLVHPLLIMDQGLRKVAAGDVRNRLEIGRDDELGDAGATLDRMTDWLRERQRMSRFVAPQVLEAVSAGGTDTTGQGQEKQLVVLVSDIRSFTGISETFPPRMVFELLNRHLEQMTQAIKGFGGTIDRFIGDAVQAVFFEGEGDPPEVRALLAAREMMRLHRRLNAERASAGLFPYRIGIGIASGPMVTGIVGDPAHRLDFTVLGEPLREAGELEAASKDGRRSLIICGKKVRDALNQRFGFRPVPGHGNAWELDEEQAETMASPSVASREERQENGEPLLTGKATFEGAGLRKGWREPLPPWFFSLVFWLLPVLAVMGALRWFDLTRRENAERATLETTRQTAELIGQTLDPAFHVSQYINRELNAGLGDAARLGICSGNGSGTGTVSASGSHRRIDDRALVKGVVPRLRRLETFFGRCRWAVFGHRAEVDRELNATTRKSTRLLARGGEPFVPPMDKANAERGFTLFKTYAVCGSPCPTLKEFELGSFSAWIGANSRQMAYTAQRSCDLLVRQSSAKELRLSYWMPFMASDVIELRLPDDLRRKTIGPSFELWEALQGGVWLDIAHECLTPDIVMRSMIRRFHREGFALAFLGRSVGGTSLSPFRDREFSRDSEIRSFLQRSEKTFVGERWVAVRGYFAKDYGGEFILARRLPAETIQGEAGGWNPWKMAVLAWAFGGPLGLWMIRTFRGRVSLSVRLVAAFVGILLPILLVGILTLERSALERKVRIESDSRRRLDAFLSRIDDDHVLYQAQQCAIIGGFVHASPFPKAVIDDETNKRWPVVCREPGKWMTLLPTAAPRLFDAFPPLAGIYWALMGSGVNLNSAVVSGVDEYSRYYPIALQKEQENITLYLFRDLFLQGLLRMGAGGEGSGEGDKERQRRELLAGAKFEELRDLFALLFSTAAFAEITGAPEVFIELLLGDVKHSLYRCFLAKGNVPGYTFQAVWNPKSLIWQHLNDLDPVIRGYEGWERRSEPRFLAALLPKEESIFHYPDPFGVPLFQHVTGDCALKRQNTLMPAPLRFLARETSQALMPAGKNLRPEGSGEEGDLVRVAIGRKLDRMLLIGVSPIGRILGDLRLGLERERLALLGLLLLTVLLARVASNRLLEPIKALSLGADQIMSGNFSIRLQIDRDDELGRLSTAFNSMARGVEEGERLSRFVSDSVREAARNEEREQAALEGVSCEAVVLFAGLPAFKEQVAQREPVGLIRDLNRHLQLLAGEVRRAGGEIDKFVGDRILAVFHVSRFGNSEAAVQAALNAAEGMCAAARSPGNPFQQPLGVGVVSGPVLAGIMGTETVRLEYTVIGDTVNLASRLCDLAGSLPGGSIVLDSRMAGFAASHGTVSPIDVRRVKGKSREVEVFRFEGAPPSGPDAPGRPSFPRGGFTLIELTMVLALLAVLASLSLPMIEVIDRRAREGALREVLRETRRAIAAYRESRASASLMLPLTLASLTETIPESMLASWANRGPFLAEHPKNPFSGEVENTCYWNIRDGSGAWQLITSPRTIVASGIFDIRFSVPPAFPWGARALDGSWYTEW